MQSPSTRRLLEAQSIRKEEQDKENGQKRNEEPIPLNAQCKKEDGSIDLNVRKLTEDETDFYNKEYGRSKIYGRKSERGSWWEEVRAEYLRTKTLDIKIGDKIETDPVEPSEEKKEKARMAWMGTLKKVKEKFAEIMGEMFQPSALERATKENAKKWRHNQNEE